MQELIEVQVNFISLIEMSFVEQEDVFNVVEKLMIKLFKEFSSKNYSREISRLLTKMQWMKYELDKPDLRNPLIISELTSLFTREDVKFDI